MPYAINLNDFQDDAEERFQFDIKTTGSWLMLLQFAQAERLEQIAEELSLLREQMADD